MIDDLTSRLQLVLGSVAALFNIAGLIAIYSYHRKTNQNMILACTSIVEILLTVCLSLNLLLVDNNALELQLKVSRAFQWMFGSMLLFNMYVLTLDRLVCFVNPIRYKARLSRKKIKFILFGCTVFSTIIGAFEFIIEHYSSMMIQYLLYIVLTCKLVYVTFAVVTYTVAVNSLKKSSTNLQATTNFLREKKMKKMFLVPGLIITSYLLFHIIPFFVFLPKILSSHTNFYKQRSTPIFGHFILIGDPLIYIFFAKHYRNVFLQKIRCCFSRRDVERNTSPFVIEINNKI